MNSFQKAVFLDRDGVLNQLVWNPATNAFESPHQPDGLIFCQNIVEPLKKLGYVGYKLFVVSNQPSYAKGKTSLESIIKITEMFEQGLNSEGIIFDEIYYCFHHPEGIVPGYSFKCVCRKPEPYFLFQAQQNHNIDLGASWMLGDRDSDVECGQKAGCRTILIKNPHSIAYQGKSHPNYCTNTLADAIEFILSQEEGKK